MPRIAFARIMQETNALSPVPTELRDFEQSHYLTGDDAPGRGRSQRPTRCPASSARPSWPARARRCAPPTRRRCRCCRRGPRRAASCRACFDALAERLTERLRAARPDGVVPGAARRDGGRRRRRSRERDPAPGQGRGRRRAGHLTHDLHANLTRARVEAADAIVGYQTNPHRDHARVGARPPSSLASSPADGPPMAWRTLPMLLGGGKTIDFLAPMRAVFRRMRAERRGEVASASTFMVHPWNDDPALGWSTLVYGEPAAAERLGRRAGRDVLGPAPRDAADLRHRRRRACRDARGRGCGASSAW
jgi:microcystin degradation protein MlrC